MNSLDRKLRKGALASWRTLACVFAASVLVAGCASQPGGGGSDFGQVNLAPGGSAACYTNPCNVLFAVPSGTGSYTVRANNQVVGTYPAGTTANLGAFYLADSPVRITVDGLAVKEAVLWISGNF